MAGGVVDLEAQPERKAPLLCLQDGGHVAVEIMDAALQHVLLIPEPAGLHEVVDVFREADLVEPALSGHLHEPLDRRDRMVDPLIGITQVHVVVDYQSSEATRSRSPASLPFTRLHSPTTLLTRPPF